MDEKTGTWKLLNLIVRSHSLLFLIESNTFLHLNSFSCGTCNAEQQMSCSADTGVWNVIFLDPCLLSSIEGCTCPSLEERSTATCYTEGQQCSYTSVTSIPQFTCSIEETCTCTTSGKYQCRLSTEVCTPLTITAFIPSGWVLYTLPSIICIYIIWYIISVKGDWMENMQRFISQFSQRVNLLIRENSHKRSPTK